MTIIVNVKSAMGDSQTHTHTQLYLASDQLQTYLFYKYKQTHTEPTTATASRVVTATHSIVETSQTSRNINYRKKPTQKKTAEKNIFKVKHKIVINLIQKPKQRIQKQQLFEQQRKTNAFPPFPTLCPHPPLLPIGVLRKRCRNQF